MKNLAICSILARALAITGCAARLKSPPGLSDAASPMDVCDHEIIKKLQLTFRL
jgi:hypothetical protein